MNHMTRFAPAAGLQRPRSRVQTPKFWGRKVTGVLKGCEDQDVTSRPQNFAEGNAAEARSRGVTLGPFPVAHDAAAGHRARSDSGLRAVTVFVPFNRHSKPLEARLQVLWLSHLDLIGPAACRG